mmetsp:Transcript_17570/g.40859  ORF Transcript_17570/g.40859 Transcript_17570/m.40859 type:complete len:216 (-) Transcript_17570:140-787(-)
MGAESILTLLQGGFKEVFHQIAPEGNLTREKYEMLPSEMRGSMGDTFDMFIKRAGAIGIDVDVDIGLTEDQYVELNTKYFANLPAERLEKEAPEVMQGLEEMISDLSGATSPLEESSSVSSARQRNRPAEAKYLKERQPEAEDEPRSEERHGALYSLAVMSTLILTWALLAWFAVTGVRAYASGSFWMPAALLVCPLPVYYYIKVLKCAIKPRKD